jgi:hypothetical protein
MADEYGTLRSDIADEGHGVSTEVEETVFTFVRSVRVAMPPSVVSQNSATVTNEVAASKPKVAGSRSAMKEH